MSILDRIEHEQREQERKAISHHPELDGRVHVLRQSSSGVMMDELEVYADYATVYKVYTWVRKALNVITTNFAPLPVRVVDSDGEEQLNHPVSLLLSNANDQSAPPDIWEKYIIHKMLGGEAFFEIVDDSRGRPVEMWPRRPDQVGLKPDESPERKLFPRVAQYMWPDDDSPVDPQHMWHDKFYNPNNHWRGLAPITAVRAGIVIDMFAQAWSKGFLKRGARPDYAYISGAALTRTEREELESKIQEKFGGVGSAHRPIVLEPGSDVKPLNFAPKDIEWLEQRKFSRDEVGAIFGIPDEIMGYGRDTYENFETSIKVLWTLTLRPLTERRDVSLSHFFTKIRPLLAPGERVETDLSGIGALEEDDAPQIEKANKLWQMGVPFNRVDERYGLGIGPVPGGEIGYLPFNLVPANGVGVAPDANGNGNGDAPVPDDTQRMITAPEHKGIEYGSAEHKAAWDRFRNRLDPHERAMQRELKRQFQEQQNDVLRRFREQASGSKVTIDLPTVGDLFNRPEQVRLWISLFTRYFSAPVEDLGQDQAGEFGIDFNLQDPLIQESLRQATLEFAQQVTRTTEDGIKGALQRALEEGLSIPDTQDLLNGVFDGRKSDFETLRIARTELSKVSNLGNLSAARQAQALGLTILKSWLAALDSRTRDSHVAAHARYQQNPISLEQDYEVGACSGPAPANTGCAEEDIFCRCTSVFVVIR